MRRVSTYGKKKQYNAVEEYEQKLKRVMERLGIEAGQYNYDWTRKTAYVQFLYKGQWYMFDHSTDKANAAGKQKLVYGTDVFAQIVLALEDLARMTERGIYDLSVWISGMKYIPQKENLPECFSKLGFTGSEKPLKIDLEARYKNLLKTAHPDNGGSTEEFCELQEAMKQCLDTYL